MSAAVEAEVAQDLRDALGGPVGALAMGLTCATADVLRRFMLMEELRAHAGAVLEVERQAVAPDGRTMTVFVRIEVPAMDLAQQQAEGSA